MRLALKSSINLLLARLSGAVAIYSLFAIVGYVNSNTMGEFNIYLSFIGIFDGLAVVTLIYFQNEASRAGEHPLLFEKGLQIALLLGASVAIFASGVMYFQFHHSRLLLPMLLTATLYPLSSSVAFMSYYLEGADQTHIVSQTHLAASLLQALLFFVLLKWAIYPIWAACITFCVKNIVALLGLLKRSKQSVVLTKNLLSKQDIQHLLHKGLPLSLGATVDRYIGTLVIIAISSFGIAASNCYAVVARMIALFLLPSICISQSLSIYYGASKNKRQETIGCVKLNIFYSVFIVSMVWLFLPAISKIMFGFNMQQSEILDMKLAVTALFISCAFAAVSFPIARAVNFIKTPQIINLIGVFMGLVIGKIFASNMIDFVYAVSFMDAIVGLVVLILTLCWKAPQFRKMAK